MARQLDESEEYDLATGAWEWDDMDNKVKFSPDLLPIMRAMASDKLRRLQQEKRQVKDWDIDWTIVIVVATIMLGICACILGGIYLGRH